MAPKANEAVKAEALRLLRRHVTEKAAPEDVLLFGARCEVCSPLLLKYGVDNGPECVYNISKELAEAGSELFCNARLNGDYIEFLLSDNGLAKLVGVSRSERPFVGAAADVIEIGINARYIHARLLHTVNTAAGGFLLPAGQLARRALWRCIMADSERSRMAALTTVSEALDEHRVKPQFSAEIAEAMASAVLDWF